MTENVDIPAVVVALTDLLAELGRQLAELEAEDPEAAAVAAAMLAPLVAALPGCGPA